MNVSPEAYSKVNELQFRDAQKLVQKIKEDILDKNERVGLIIDVGCGCGNVTNLLADCIPHERMLSCDIDEKMVEASRNLLSSKSTVDVFVQDISQPWEKLDRKLREVEGQVDVVFSNHVLHWINVSLQPIVVSNLLRLLRPGGRIYLNVGLIRNFNEFLPPDEKERNEKLLKIPSREEQQKSWMDLFKNSGLENINVEYFTIVGEFQNNSTSLAVFAKFSHFIATYLPVDLEEEERLRIVNGFTDVFMRCYATPMGTKLIEKVESHVTKYYADQLYIIGQK